jgi:exodeoxyribonuclease V alpha subunit
VAAADQTLEGTVERVTFYNPENGFSVVKLRLRGRRAPVAAVGTLPEVQPGEGLRLEGAWQTDPRHGAQFRIERATVRPPSELDDLVRYLGSGRVRQLGPVLARRIVETFGQRTLEVLEQQPERVREVPGIGSLRARALAAAWREQQSLRAVARFLSEHPKVANVRYPGLPSDPGHAIATRQMSGFGGIVAFVLRGGLPAAERFYDGLRLMARAASLGGVETTVSYPEITSHRSMSGDERAALGVGPGTVRVSVGIEDPDDIVADFAQALSR